MSSLVNLLIKQSLQTFSLSKTDIRFHQNFQKLLTLLQQLKPHDLNINPNSFHNLKRIAAMDIFRNDLFEMVVFIVPAGQKLPLHDHPGMYGLIKILFGTVRLTNFSILPNCKNHMILVKKTTDQYFDEFSGVSTFSPNESNFHEIVCETNSTSKPNSVAFLDILAPPYTTSYDHRDCTYFKLGKQIKNDEFELIPNERCIIWMDNFAYLGPKIELTNDP